MPRQVSMTELHANCRNVDLLVSSSGAKLPRLVRSAALLAASALIALSPAAMAQSVPGAPASARAAVPADINPEGLYAGSIMFRQASASYPVYAIVLKDGTTSFFIRTSSSVPGSPHGFALSGVTIKPRGTVFSSPFVPVTQPGYAVGNLPHFAGSAGTINGVFRPGGTISGRFMTPHDTGTFTLKPMTDDYARSVSPEAIAGSFDYDFPVKGGAATGTDTVQTDGTATGTESAVRCTTLQKYMMPDASRNALAVDNSVACRSGGTKRYSGLQAYFPKGTGATWNEGKNFEADTLVTITQGSGAGFMRMAMRQSPEAAAIRANPSVAGLYHGEMTVAGSSAKYPVFAIVLKDGKASVFVTTAFPAPDSPQGFAFRGVNFKPDGANFETPFTPFTQTGAVTPGLEKFAGAPGIIRGTIKPGVSITGTYQNPVASGTLTLTAMPEEYGRMGSGEDIAGVYDHVFTTRGMQVIGYEVLKPDGTNVHYDDVLQCPVLQIYTVPDAYHNTYSVENRVACPGRPVSKYEGLQAFFPRGTGAQVNGGTPFTTDTILAITEDNRTGFLKIAK